jgi:glutamate-5-semialdehyde dehydrogenase
MKAFLNAQLRALALQARDAIRPLVRTSAAQRSAAITAMADCLQRATPQVLAANAQDLRNAAEAGLSAALQDRLTLGPERLQGLQAALRAIAAQPDPIGQQTPRTTLQNGLQMHRQRLPLGVILMIYESRPNVTLDAAALCLRSANVAILRGGSEALQTNLALVAVVKSALQQAGLPAACVQWVPTQQRAAIDVLLTYDDCINLVIPRGGAGLIAHVVAHSRINVVRHDRGLCHIYVDATAEQQMACDIVHNAKVQRPGVCNAVETLLVARAAAKEFLPACLQRLQADGVQIRGCAQTQALVPGISAASDADWDTEFLAPILAVRIVDGLEAAMAHIDQHGTSHTAAILSADAAAVQTFLQRVDASCVVANASTRFNDGGELGLGAELGISTSRVHAYGAMGAASLTCEKYVLHGQGQIRS